MWYSSQFLAISPSRDEEAEIEALADPRGVSISALVRETVGAYLRERRATTSLEVQDLVDRPVEDATEVRRRLVG